MNRSELSEAIASVPAWYHSMELAPGVVTPGYFDLRSIVDRLPWPDVKGKRCLDIGTYDGFYAFELERRGAAEVIAIDVPDPHKWDWPPDARENGPREAIEFNKGQHAPGFDVARKVLGSAVERRSMTIYEVSEAELGRFDVIVVGSLLLHLRDPLRALEAVRGVCDGTFLSVDEVRLSLRTRQPLAEFNGSGNMVQWWVPNPAGHERMLFAAGFDITRREGPFAIPRGASHPLVDNPPRPTLHTLKQRIGQRVLAGGEGVPHQALLAKPRL
jgi:tRNA (mo5U34)-methyltransferase